MEFFGTFILVAALGLVFGSFASAIAYRVPRGVSWVKARSSCCSCQASLGVRDLVPLVSWCLNKGACRHCGVRVSVCYPLLELASMVMCLAVYAVYGVDVPALLVYAAVPFLLALFLIDLEHMVLPNQLVFILFVLGALRLGVLWWNGAPSGLLVDHGAAVLFYAFLSWAVGALMGRILKKEALGFGDVKFFGVAGLWLGVEALPLFMIISGLTAVCFALIWRFVRKSAVFPFGPALIAAFFVLLLCQGGGAIL